MRVVVDSRAAVFPHKTGVGFYTWHLLRLLPRLDPTTTYVAWYVDARSLLGGPRSPLRELAAILRSESGRNTIFTLDLEGTASEVMFHERQVDPIALR